MLERAVALTNSTAALNPNIVSMKGIDEAIKDSTRSLNDQNHTIVQTTEAWGPIHDAHLLGIRDLGELRTKIQESQEALDRLVNAGLIPEHQAMEKQLQILQESIGLHRSLGENTDALQLKAIHLADAIHTQNVGFTDTVVAMHGVMQSGFDTALNNLITQSGSVGDAFKKMGESLVTTFADRILNDALKPVLNALDGIIDKALKAAEKMLGIKLPGSNNSDNTDSIATPPFAGGSIPGLGGGDGGGGDSGAGGAVGSAASGAFSSVFGMVTGAISAVTGVISIFQNMHQETSLNAIELNTRLTAIAMVGAWQSNDQDTMWAHTKSIKLNTDRLAPMQGALDQINGHMIDAVTYLSQSAGGTTTAAALTAGLGDSTNTLVEYIVAMWGALHTDLVGIWSNVIDAGSHLKWIADHTGLPTTQVVNTLPGGGSLPAGYGGAYGGFGANAGNTGAGTAGVPAGTYAAAQDSQSAMNVLSVISDKLSGIAKTAMDGFTGSLSGLTGILNAANQALPRLDNLVANSAALLNKPPSITVNVYNAGDVVAENNLVNKISDAIASQLRLQRVQA